VKDTAETAIANKDKPSFWLLHSLGWLTYVVIFTIDNVVFYRDFNRLGLEVFIPLLLAGITAALLTVPLRYLYRLCWKLPSVWLIAAITMSSLVIAVIWTPIKNVAMWYFYENFDVLALLNGQFQDEFRWYMLFMSFSYAFFMIFVWSTLYFGINYHFRLLNEKQLHIEAVRLSHISQIKMLRYQINPHFLFNTLNAVSTLVLRGSKDKANGMLIRLATFLRFSLDNDPEKKIRLYEELKALMLYLEIEKTRFDDRLTVKFDIEPEAEALLLPSLLLQPLVENSIKYAIAQLSCGGFIKVSATRNGGYLNLEVVDNGPAKDAAYIDGRHNNTVQTASSHTGVGVQNIIDRLKVLYPNNHKFSISRGETAGYQVNISLPMEYA
jgi:hypothetical protein